MEIELVAAGTVRAISPDSIYTHSAQVKGK